MREEDLAYDIYPNPKTGERVIQETLKSKARSFAENMAKKVTNKTK